MLSTRRSFLQSAAASGTLLGLGGMPALMGQGAPAASGKKLRLLILGGTGFLGPHIVEYAVARGHQLTLFNRGKTNPGLFPDLESLRGNRDPRVDEGLTALEGREWDAVIDTSGYVPRIVRASAEVLAGHVQHYVFVSTVSVYASYDEAGMTESAALATVEDETTEDVRLFYGALKALCEQAAEDALPQRVTSIRPGLIVGPLDPTDRFTYWPVRMARGGEVLAPGAPGDPVQFIDARDLAAWIVRCVEESTFGVFNACGPVEPCSIGGLLEACQFVCGNDASLSWVDAEFLAEQGLQPWADLPVWAPAEGALVGLGTVSNRKAVSAGLTSRPVEATVRDTLEWWYAEPEERRKSLRAGLSADREAEVLAAWHAR